MPKEERELKWLKELREENKLTTYSVAEKLGISQSQYSSIENGTRNVSVENAKKIAKLFNFDWTRFYE